MSIEIEIDYEVGVGGNATVTKNNEEFNFMLDEFDENQYADVGLEIVGDDGQRSIIDDIYNRNSLPGLSEIDNRLTKEEYDKIFSDLHREIVGMVKFDLESMFD